MNFLDKRLVIGAGKTKKKGADWLHHDFSYYYDHIDCAWDLNVFPYPWPSDSLVEIEAINVLEHIDDPLRSMEEFHRMLKSGGRAVFRVPLDTHQAFWDDMTHKRMFTTYSFDYLDPGTDRGNAYGFYSDCRWDIIRKDVLTEDQSVPKAMIIYMEPIK